MLRLRTPITDEELAALIVLAQQEMRNPGEQAHFIIRQELKRLGLLDKDDCTLAGLDKAQPLHFHEGDHQD